MGYIQKRTSVHREVSYIQEEVDQLTYYNNKVLDLQYQKGFLIGILARLVNEDNKAWHVLQDAIKNSREQH